MPDFQDQDSEHQRAQEREWERQRERREGDPFEAERSQQSEASPFGQSEQQKHLSDEHQHEAFIQDQLKQAQENSPGAEPPPREMLSELQRQDALTPDAAERLFQHYAEERAKDEDGEQDPITSLQVDVRQQSRDVPQPSLDPQDTVRDGLEGDFVADSAIVAADLDTHPHADPHSAGFPGPAAPFADDLADGWAVRRRRAGVSAPPPADPQEQPAEPEFAAELVAPERGSS